MNVCSSQDSKTAQRPIGHQPRGNPTAADQKMAVWIHCTEHTATHDGTEGAIRLKYGLTMHTVDIMNRPYIK